MSSSKAGGQPFKAASARHFRALILIVRYAVAVGVWATVDATCQSGALVDVVGKTVFVEVWAAIDGTGIRGALVVFVCYPIVVIIWATFCCSGARVIGTNVFPVANAVVVVVGQPMAAGGPASVASVQGVRGSVLVAIGWQQRLFFCFMQEVNKADTRLGCRVGP